MQFMYLIGILLIIFILISLLFNPYVWMLVIVLSLYSWIKRSMFVNDLQKQQKEMYRNKERNTSHGDVIDVEYTVVDEDK